jgi:2-methylisocitrate lyase-like PEP mutase family enzyme
MALQGNGFRQLHDSGCFVIPNPWDVGSARYLETLGFKALASSSAGLAFSLGLSDEALTREMVLRHLQEVASAVNVPVNADFQAGYGAGSTDVFESVRLCVETGVAGLSIEDATNGLRGAPLFDLNEAVERLRAAKESIISSGRDVVLTARAECFLTGHPDPLRESIRRLTAYSEAGADVLFAPGLRNREEILAVVDAVSPKPLNVLISSNIGLSVADLAGLGVRRISVGSALARTAWTGFMRAANEMANGGTFGGLENLVPFKELNELFL